MLLYTLTKNNKHNNTFRCLQGKDEFIYPFTINSLDIITILDMYMWSCINNLVVNMFTFQRKIMSDGVS
jgi:hypothetical protein